VTRKTREVAIYVYRGDRFLIARRVPQGVWNVIAGQVEDGESFSAAAARELMEESGLSGALTDLAMPQTYVIEPEYLALYAPGESTVAIESFMIEAPSGWEPTLNHEHDAYRWCSAEEAIALLHWPETKEGLRAVAQLLRRGTSA
jgi:8-oxo-dGTP pyrophosphatase MutT (NUDIX family)